MMEASTMRYGDRRSANFTLINGRKELSITVDNGPFCKTEKLYRDELRCYNGKEDVTALVFGCKVYEVVKADVANVAKAMNWLQLSSDPFSCV